MPYNNGYYLGGRYRNGDGDMMRPYNFNYNYDSKYGPYRGGKSIGYNPFSPNNFIGPGSNFDNTRF